MARSLTSSARAKAEAPSGVEAFVVLEIQWGANGTRYFGDKVATIGTIVTEARILRLSPIRSQVGVEDQGSASVLSVELSDSDLVLRGLTDQAPLEHRPVRVLHAFEGLDEDDLVELLNGVVSSPVTWSEKDRVLRFEVEGRANSQSVAYTPAAEDFANLHADGVGKTWPVVFGTAVDVPAAIVKRAPLGRLAEDIGMDTTAFDVLEAEDFPTGEALTLHVGDEYILGEFRTADNPDADAAVKTFTITTRNRNKFDQVMFANRPLGHEYEDCSEYAWLADSTQRVVGTFLVIGAVDVPGSSHDKYNFVISQEGDLVRFQWGWGNGAAGSWLLNATTPANGAASRGWVEADEFRVLEAGSPVAVQGDEEDVFVANELESTEVLRVRAFRTVQYNRLGAEREVLVDVPEEYYTVDLSDEDLGAPDGRTPTTITFPIRLSERGRWKDDVVYVSLESSQGSNTADVIEFLLDEYTDLEPDATAFAAVRTALANYPSHFYLGSDLGQADALQAAAEIAWQARCGLFTVGQAAFLRYLSAEPSSTDAAVTLDDAADNVQEASVSFENTDLEDVVTVLKAEWRPEGSADWRDIPYEANVSTYGRRERRYRFFIYQNEDLVQKSAAFWSARYARVWRRLRLVAFLDALGVDLLDSIGLGLSGLGIPSTIGRVVELAHDTSSNLIELLLWLPIEVGTVVESSSAYDDDSGDTAPADPSVDVSPAPPELEVVSATQRNTFSIAIQQASSVPAKITGDLGSGQYQAVTYPEGLDGSPSDTITLTRVGETDLEVDDEILAAQSPGGGWYGSKGGGGGALVKPAVVLSGTGSGPYTLGVYDNGIDESMTETVLAYPLQIRSGHSFKAGLMVFIVWCAGAVSGAGRWYFWGPVWTASS